MTYFLFLFLNINMLTPLVFAGDFDNKNTENTDSLELSSNIRANYYTGNSTFNIFNLAKPSVQTKLLTPSSPNAKESWRNYFTTNNVSMSILVDDPIAVFARFFVNQFSFNDDLKAI